MSRYYSYIRASDTATNDGTRFPNSQVSSFIRCLTPGDLVYEDSAGDPQYLPGLKADEMVPVHCRSILANATVRGVARTTTGTYAWCIGNEGY